MDPGGYVNEDDELEPVMDDEGGQLKSSNGQKYIINNPPRGRYCSNCTIAALVGLIFLLLATSIGLLVLVLHPDSLCTKTSTPVNGAVQHASTFGFTRAPANPKLNTALRTLEDGSADGARNEDYIDDAAEAQPDPFPAEANNDAKDPAVQLSRADFWLPRSYSLIIEPNITSAINNGTVTIEIERNRRSKSYGGSAGDLPPVVLDIEDIFILSTSVLDTNSGEELQYETYYGPQNASFVFELSGDLKSGLHNVTLVLSFVSKLSDTLQGYYRGYYPDKDAPDGRNWFVSTQFSPIDARRAFPCFDSPDRKATFAISVVRPADKHMTLSNMDRVGQYGERPGFVRDVFEVTPRMSTYLVAFITSDLELAQPPALDFKPSVSIWTRPDVRHHTNYVHRLTMRILPFLEEYFGLKYHLRKIDMVAVPDFGFRAMENWGLITFRESALLVPEDNNRSSSAKHTEAVASVVAHELVHQWFGNLVTPRWWNDLWLKEGFATYLSYVCLNVAEKRWRPFEMFVQKELQEAFEKDSDRNSHPISFPVTVNSDIRRIFDPISYSKGAAIVRMMDSFLGTAAFKAGISEYLRRFQFANAEQDDLWELLTAHGHKASTLPSDIDVKRIMETWTLQPGYPVLTVERNGTQLHISQQRYILPSRTASDDTRWYVPFTVVTEGQAERKPHPMYWLPFDNASMTLTIDAAEDEYVYVNDERAGYFRVNYDYATWKKLTNSFAQLPPLTRAQLIDDAFNLARAEFIQYDIPITLIVIVVNRPDDMAAWAALSRSLTFINHMISREPAYESYLAVMRAVLRPPFDTIGFEDHPTDSHLAMMHRERIVGLACLFGIDKCSVQAQTLFRRWMSDYRDNRIPPNLKEIIYCTSVRDGGVPEWNFAFKRYMETDSPSEKELILNALGCSVKPWLLTKYLNMTIDPNSGILKQDGVRAFQSVATNYAGNDIAFNFLYENIEQIYAYYGDGFSALSKMIDAVTVMMNKPQHQERFDRFARKAHRLGLTTVEKSIRLAREQILNNIYWRSRSYYELERFLKQFMVDMHINLY
ncbi:aminopeptidase N [Anopheles ziemanni]|uniref:aminopeptidase N n=1 Tax=Anopheles coustani TaxID=139045 RepID=UPI0026589014|nr:aminopeptidase N [Anopheles coustani]XP_058176220.1 aminopeptidase N [Anopheles ziemanni]